VLLVPGEAEGTAATRGAVPGTGANAGGTANVKHAVRVSATREGAPLVRAEADPGTDVVVLQLANGPELVLHPETARDLMAAQAGAARARGAAGGAAGEVPVPARLAWPQPEPGAAAGQKRGIGA